MEIIPQDYQPEVELKSFPDGKYKAKGIRWLSLDDRQNPVLVYQKGNGKMVARCRFIVEGQEGNGPPMSIELNQVALLVRAFSPSSVDKLPAIPPMDSPGLVSQYLTVAEKLINESSKTISIEVNNGWVDRGGVSGMEITGYIYFKFKGVVPNYKTGRIEPMESRYTDDTDENKRNSFFYTLWEVVAGEGGSKSPFDGVTFTESNNYAVVVRDGKPDWQRTSTGNYTLASVIMANMMRLTAPQMFEDNYECKDPYNVLPEWNDFALANENILKGERSKSERGKIRINWSSVQPASLVLSKSSESSKSSSTSVKSSAENKLDDSVIDSRARDLIKDLLNELTEGEAFVENSFNLTDAGSATAKTYLKPLKVSGILSHGIIKNLTFDEVKAILDNISVPDSFSSKLVSYKHKLAAIGIGDIGTDDESADADF